MQSGSGFDADATDFDMLLAAVQAAGLGDALDAPGADLTVFAPIDAAFVAAAQSLGYPGTDEAGAFAFLEEALTLLSRGGDIVPLLSSVLTYHVSPGAKDATAVLSADTLPTLLGQPLTVDGTTLVDAEPDLPDPTIIATNIALSNGIVHVLDGVLLPDDLLPSNGANSVDFLIARSGPVALDLGLDDDYIKASEENDLIVGGPGDDVLLGEGGTDTARFANDFATYGLKIQEDGVIITNRGEQVGVNSGQDFLKDFELLEFGDGASFVADGAVDLSILEGARRLSSEEFTSLVELYVAYFDRAPDALGLLFWANARADGVSMGRIAELFFEQPETQTVIPPDLDTGSLVDLAYAHVLERTADAAGRAFWIDALDSGGVSRSEFILELLAGARAPTGSAEDVRTIEDKTDIGVSYALIEGLTNVANAATVMQTYDRMDADASLALAQSQIEDFALLATGAADGPEATVQIIGVVDDPFAMG